MGLRHVLTLLVCLSWPALAAESSEDEYRHDFAEFDLNKDNQIDFQELRIQVKGELDATHLRRLVMDMDKDQSGAISLEEYVAYALTL